MTNGIKTLTIIFSNRITKKEIIHFRGAVISALTDNNVLFHNHKEKGFRYSYPLIQYKRIRGKAAIVGIGEGITILDEMLSSGQITLRLKKKETVFYVEEKITEELDGLFSNEMASYQLHEWIPLNSENYETYNSSESLAFRLTILEKILVGNLISFVKGMGIHLDQQINVSITQLKHEKVIKYKDVGLMCFDIIFKTNIVLPKNIGLGKSTSIGFGIINKH